MGRGGYHVPRGAVKVVPVEDAAGPRGGSTHLAAPATAAAAAYCRLPSASSRPRVVPIPPDDPLDHDALLALGVATIDHRAEAGSTMDVARAIATAADHPLPAVVIADRQTSGRGRRGAGWWQAPGSLAMSLVVDAHSLGAESPQPIWSLACGVALAEAIRLVEPEAAALVRWPNDIEVAGRKLAGILVETAGGSRVIFGVGVNTTGSAAAAPAPIAGRVATMPDLVGRPLERQRLLAAFVPRLLGLLAESARDPGRLAARYRPLCSLSGHLVRVHVGGGIVEGTCGGIAPDGRLVIDTPGGRELVVSGSLTPPEAIWRGDA